MVNLRFPFWRRSQQTGSSDDEDDDTEASDRQPPRGGSRILPPFLRRRRQQQNGLPAPRIQITRTGRGKSFACTVSVSAPIQLPVDVVYYILTSPENHRIFRNQRPPAKRTVISDTKSVQQVEIHSLGQWRFLRFSGTFPIHLMVRQDHNVHQVKFHLLSTGLMRTFQGLWKVKPCDSPFIKKHLQPSENPRSKSLSESEQSTVVPVNASQSAAASSTEKAHEAAMRHIASHLSNVSQARKSSSLPISSSSSSYNPKEQVCCVTLEQQIRLAIMPPPPLDRIFYRVVGRITRNVLKDLQDEAIRVRRGKPTIRIPSDMLKQVETDSAQIQMHGLVQKL